MSLSTSLCPNHKKQQSILLVHSCKYICQDCAIYNNSYKNQKMIQKQSLPQQTTKIHQTFHQLFQIQKTNKILIHDNMKQLILKIQQIQEQYINKLNRQFLQVKRIVSNYYLMNTQIKENQRLLNGRQKCLQIYKENGLQEKLKKSILNQNKIKEYKKYLGFQESLINQCKQEISEKLDRLILESNVKKVFTELFQEKNNSFMNNSKNNQNKKQQNKCLFQFKENQDEQFLLDFSEFNIQHHLLSSNTGKTRSLKQTLTKQVNQTKFQLSQQKTQKQNSLNNCAGFSKKNQFQRMKTAQCLEDSICSIQSSSKQSTMVMSLNINTQKSICFNDKIKQNFDQKSYKQFSLLSDRSMVSSQEQNIYEKDGKSKETLSNSTSNPSKKLSNTIQIKSRQQLNSTKIQAISPLVKTIKLNNLSLSTQQFTTLLKQNISRSFITSLQINLNPKIQDKVLLEIRQWKPKTLKKVEMKQCKDINWNQKRVKQMVKKLQAEGVKIVI